MSRRDQKRQAYAEMLVPQARKQDTASKEHYDKVCGTCTHYSESSYERNRGSCRFLKIGSNIASNPPVFVLDGKDGYLTMTLSDASKCNYYEKMKMIDKDGYECSDPQYRRSIRQLQDK